MATYAIGDIQGCFDELQALLRLIAFDVQHDCLWFVGDLVNRGPMSLEVLRFVKQLPQAVVVLGNHDLHLLSIYHDKDPLLKAHNLQEVILAPDAPQLLNWLRKQPLLHHDSELGFTMVHAGIYPHWSLQDAQLYAQEAEIKLRADNYVDFLHHMYGDTPDVWRDDLTDDARLRFIINSFVRMRFSDQHGKLDFINSCSPSKVTGNLIPWFDVPQRKTVNNKIIFGHWASLEGKVKQKNIYADE